MVRRKISYSSELEEGIAKEKLEEKIIELEEKSWEFKSLNRRYEETSKADSILGAMRPASSSTPINTEAISVIEKKIQENIEEKNKSLFDELGNKIASIENASIDEDKLKKLIEEQTKDLLDKNDINKIVESKLIGTVDENKINKIVEEKLSSIIVENKISKIVEEKLSSSIDEGRAIKTDDTIKMVEENKTKLENNGHLQGFAYPLQGLEHPGIPVNTMPNYVIINGRNISTGEANLGESFSLIKVLKEMWNLIAKIIWLCAVVVIVSAQIYILYYWGNETGSFSHPKLTEAAMFIEQVFKQVAEF